MVTASITALSSALHVATFCCVGLSFGGSHAIQLDGVNGRLNLDPAPLGTPASLTVELWVRLDEIDRTQILVTNAFNDFNDGFTLVLGADNKVSFVAVGPMIRQAWARGTTVLEPGVWYHIAGVYDADARVVRVVIDGEEDGISADGRGIFHSSARDLRVGMQNKSLFRSSRFLAGSVDELRIWSVARTAEEIEAARWGELSEDVEGLLGYWPMNEGSGSTTEDFSGVTNNARLEGGATWTSGDWKQELLVTIDIKPDDADNVINIDSRGMITVALFSTPDLDVAKEIDRRSLSFGRSGDEPSLHARGYGTPNCGVEDVNSDGLKDLICKFKAPEAGFTVDDDEGILRGRTRGGEEFTGRDWIRVVMSGGPAAVGYRH